MLKKANRWNLLGNLLKGSAFIIALMILLFNIPACLANEAIETAKASTVRVLCETAEGTASGSGFVLEDGMYVVTNNHVIEGGGQVSIFLGGDTYVDAKVKWKSAQKDLAILEVPDRLDKSSMILAAGSTVSDADTVYALGFPGDADRNESSLAEVKITKGIISASSRDENNTLIFQTDAAINHGNSGGPLVNEAGQVIGINYSKSVGQDVEGIGYAIQVDELTPELDKLDIKYDLIKSKTGTNGDNNSNKDDSTNKDDNSSKSNDSKDSSSSSDKSKDSKDSSTKSSAKFQITKTQAMIGGIAIGVLLLVIIVIIVVVRSKKKKAQNAAAYDSSYYYDQQGYGDPYGGYPAQDMGYGAYQQPQAYDYGTPELNGATAMDPVLVDPYQSPVVPVAAPVQTPEPTTKAIMIGISGEHAGDDIELSSDWVMMGRDPAVCQLVFEASSSVVSRRHCMIKFDSHRQIFIVQDLGSSNGTYLGNGQKLEKNKDTELRPGDRFCLGTRDNNCFEVRLERR